MAVGEITRLSLHVAYGSGDRTRTPELLSRTMRQSRGPAKKLAPALAPESACKHEFAVADGLQLEVDCETCAGAQDLENRVCMVGIMNVVARGAVPDIIILKRFMHRRYRGDAVRTVAEAASELSSLTRALRCASTPSDRRCRTCPCSLVVLVTRLRTMLLEDAAAYIREPARARLALSEAVEKSGCEKGAQCANHARAASVILNGGH